MVYWVLVLSLPMSGTAFVTQHAAAASAARPHNGSDRASPVGTVKES